jgi:tetratricopeptide (TPR) repeat protein
MYGNMLHQAGKYCHAIEVLRKAIEVDPDYHEAYWWLGWMHF